MPLDAIAVFSILDRVTDDNGDPVPGAIVYFYQAGTTTPLTVYSDYGLTTSLGTSVTCDDGGFPTSDGNSRVVVYTGTDAYKIVVKDSDGVTLWTLDNIRAASTIPDVASSALPQTPVVSKSSTYNILTTDAGKLINANSTGGGFAVTLPAALTAGDAYRVGVRHNGTANTVTTRTVGSDVIRTSGTNSARSVVLTGLGHTYWFACDGSGWSIDCEVPPLISGGFPLIKVADRLSAPPTSPEPGGRYIVTGTPTGAWATLLFAEHQVVESDGNGSWIAYTPQSGWLAYVDDETLYTSYNGTTWVDQGGMTTPADGEIAHAVYEHQASSGTGGGTPTASAWTTRPLTTEVIDTIGASLATNAITLPVGKYLIRASQQIYVQVGTLGAASNAQQRLVAGTAVFSATPSPGMPVRNGGVASGAGVVFTSYDTHNLNDTWIVDVTTAGTMTLEYYVTSATATNGLGFPLSLGTEVYARVEIFDLAFLQGPPGPQGSQGPEGLDAAHPYAWSTLTTGDPGSGNIRVNNATLASLTELAISETNSAGGDMAGVLATWDDGTSSVKCRVNISEEGNPQNYCYVKITGDGTDQGGYWTFPATYVGSDNTLANGVDVAVNMVPHGDQGDAGVTVPDISGLTALTSFQRGVDFGILYDGSASSHKKVDVEYLFPFYTPEEFGCVGNGSTEDTTNFQLALDALETAGGGTLWLRKKYLVDDITLARNVYIIGVGGTPMQPLSGVSAYSYNQQIILKTGASITMAQSSSLENLTITRQGLAPMPPTSSAEAATLVGTYAGTAVTGTGVYFSVKGCLIAGHALAINCTATASQGGLDAYGNNIDCLAGILMTGGGFNTSWAHNKCWPYLTAAVAAAGSAGLHRSGVAFRMVGAGGAGNDWTVSLDNFSYGYLYGHELDTCSGVILDNPQHDYGAGYGGSEIGIYVHGSTLGRIKVRNPKVITLPTGITVDVSSATSSAHVEITSPDIAPNGTGINGINGVLIVKGGTITNATTGIAIGANVDHFVVDLGYMDTCTTGLSVDASFAGTGVFVVPPYSTVTTPASIPDAVLDQITILGGSSAAGLYNTLRNLYVYETNAQIIQRAISGTSDENLWDSVATGSTLLRRAGTDAGTYTAYETVTRSGGTPGVIAWGIPARSAEFQIEDPDTSLTRSSAGRAAIDGNEIALYGSVGPAWDTYTPTVGGISGTATGYYKRVGKTMHFSVQITVTTGGATAPTFTLPAQAANDIRYIVGGKNATAGTQWSTLIDPDATTAILIRYDGSGTTATSDVLVASGTYQVQ